MNALNQNETAATRDEMILEHLPQVEFIARRIYSKCPGNVCFDDLVSTGTVGLITAIDRFDPTQGVKLKTYAEYKIRGAILDSLRSMDWAPREQRRRAKQIQTAMASLEQRLHRSPSELEIAAELGISMSDYREWLSDGRNLTLGSLDAGFGGGDDSRDLMEILSDDKSETPAQLLERSELRRLVARGIERMPETERTVLSLYFQKELTLREIATVMGLHESRISQLKSQGILRLRASFQKSWPTRGTATKTFVMAAAA